MSDDGVAAIHQAALGILADTGIVRMDPDMVTDKLATAPPAFEIRSRSGERDVEMSGPSVAFLPVSGLPHTMDLDRGRRAGTSQDFADFIKLAQSFDVIHGLGPSVEPQDVPLELRHHRETYE